MALYEGGRLLRDIILPANFKIRNHAAQRFLERIILKDSYTADDEELAIEVIRNILSNRTLKQRLLGDGQIQLRYRNAVFVYDKETNCIITSYPEDNSKNKVEWVYKFPAPLVFKGMICSDRKLKLITQGFVPVRKEERCIIGESGSHLFCYDPKYNIIWPIEQVIIT